MANIKSAKKKVRKDIKRTKSNDKQRQLIKKTIREVKKSKNVTADLLKKAYSIIDKASREKIIHKNKAARLKARVSKLFNKKKNEK